VAAHSQVETFAALRLAVDSWRWQGVPFYIRAGKSLPVTCTEVVARLRRPPTLFPGRPSSNYLRFRISPVVEVAMGLNVMDQVEKGDGETVELLASRHPGSNEVDAYERVLTDAMAGDRTLFAREDYIEEAWRIVDPVLQAGTALYEYDPGSWVRRKPTVSRLRAVGAIRSPGHPSSIGNNLRQGQMDAIAAATLEPGKSFPLGASLVGGGANFSVFSKHATALQLLLFDGVDDDRPSRVINLDPQTHRTYHYWHTFVPDLKAGQLYAYRAHGPYAPERGLRFDGDKVLLDPYGKCVARPSHVSRAAARVPGDNAAMAMKSVLADPGAYDWEDDRPPRTPFEKTVIYELHVGNFTRHPNSDIADGRRGTFAGLIEKLPYLQDLGVSALELLPVFAFDEETAPEGRRNIWATSQCRSLRLIRATAPEGILSACSMSFATL